MSKFDTTWLILSLLNKNIKAIPLEPYVDDKTPILFKCEICKHEWKVDPSHLKSGRTCPNCKKLNKLETNKRLFIIKAENIHRNKYNYDKVNYTKLQNKVIITCPIHGDFEQTPMAHLRGLGCPLCAGNNFLRTTNLFIALGKLVHGDNYDYSFVEYKTCKTAVSIRCNKCGEVFLQTPDKHLGGHGCPKCTLKSQTLLYNRLQNFFKDDTILFEVSNRIVPWLENLRFDIYFPKYNIAIEYNGKQHYVPVEHFGGKLEFEKTLERDKLKREKCRRNGCTLFEVKYNYSEKDFLVLCSQIKETINKSI